MDERTILMVMTSIFGISATGFFFLAMWLRNIGIDMQKLRLDMESKVPFKWIEETFKPEITADLREIIDELRGIKVALVGDIDRKGLLTRVHEHQNKLDEMERVCTKKHESFDKGVKS